MFFVWQPKKGQGAEEKGQGENPSKSVYCCLAALRGRSTCFRGAESRAQGPDSGRQGAEGLQQGDAAIPRRGVRDDVSSTLLSPASATVFFFF